MKYKSKLPAKKTTSCCGSSKSCSTAKVVANTKKPKTHELDELLSNQARKAMVKDYLRLAAKADGKRFFKSPTYTPHKDAALVHLEQVFDLTGPEVKALSSLR